MLTGGGPTRGGLIMRSIMSATCPDYDSLRYVVTARFMFDNDENAREFMKYLDQVGAVGEFAREIALEEYK